MTRLEEPTRECTAYHEAGHAGMALRLGRSFRYVTIKADEETLGHVKNWSLPPSFRPDIEVTPRGERLLRDRVMIMLAGGLAAQKHCPCAASGDLILGDYIIAGDTHNAVEFAYYVTGGDPDEAELYIAWLQHRTEGLLSNTYNWAGVEGIARALLEREHLTYTEAADAWHSGLLRSIEAARKSAI